MTKMEIYIDKQGQIGLENVADLLEAYPGYARRAITSALKSEGFRVKGIIQDAIDHGGPSNEKWKKLNPNTPRMSLGSKWAKRGKKMKNFTVGWRGEKGRKKRVREYGVFPKKYSKSHLLGTRSNPLSKFRGGVRYKFADDGGEMSVNMGFVNASRKLLALVHKQAEGYSTPVTDKTRRFAFAMGFYLSSSTTTMVTPARPLIPPIMRQEHSRINNNIRQKYLLNVARYMAEGGG